MLVLRMPLTGAWIITRLLLVPILYIPYRLGWTKGWLHEIDAFVKRQLFPLTERPDLAWVQQVEPRIGIGDSIPEFTVTGAEGEVELPALTRDRPLLLILYRGNWCPYSRLHMTNLAGSYERFEQAGIGVLGVTTNSRAAWWRSKGVRFPMADGPTGQLYDLMGVKVKPSLPNRVWGTTMPHESVFLFDRGGQLVACDTRQLSSTKIGQTFLAADAILQLATAKGIGK